MYNACNMNKSDFWMDNAVAELFFYIGFEKYVTLSMKSRLKSQNIIMR